jgi:hypothetical protein
MHVIHFQVNFKFMPKIFNPQIPTFYIGPMPNNSPSYPELDNKYWNARKALSYTFKKFFYLRYIASFKVSASTTGFYKSGPFNVGDYCKNNITVTTSNQFKILKSLSKKEYDAESANITTFPPSIHELMCGYCSSSWYGTVEQKYRRTNAGDGGIGVPNVSNRTEKKRNCYPDYDDDGNKISENPDYSFWDYTVTFNSILSMSTSYGYTTNYLDDTNYTVQPSIQFGESYNHMGWPSDNEQECTIKSSGSLIFLGITLTSSVLGLGTACGNEGNINMQENWSASTNLKLINN